MELGFAIPAQRPRDESGDWIRRFAFLSLLLHLLCGGAVIGLQSVGWLNSTPAPDQQSAPIEVVLEPQTSHRNRIVQTERGKEVAQAPKDAYLGERNQEVDRQTRSRSQAITQAGAPRVAPQAPAKTAPAPKLAQLGLGDFVAEASKTAPKSADQDRQWAPFSNRAQDYVPGVQEGDQTAFNTKEYKFYSYYQRIRGRLDQAWVPMLKTQLIKYYRTGRQLASDQEHTTRLMVVLNREGEIVRVQLVGESGTRDLDQVAIEAFNKAGPFPNPPKGIVDAQGEIQIPWDFILKT